MKYYDKEQLEKLNKNSVYDHKRFTIMHVEKIKTYKDFSIRASVSFINSCNDKWELK